MYIYIIYTPNLGSRITLFDREREQGRFRGSTGGALGRSKRAKGAQQESKGSGSSREPDLAAPYPAIAAPIILLIVLPSLAYYYLDSYSFAGS